MKKLDALRQEPEQVTSARESSEPVAAAVPTLGAPLAAEREIIREQAEKIAQLQRELGEARRHIRLLESENAEISATLQSVKESVGWKLVRKYRRTKNSLLPPGTFRRRLYDRMLTRVRTSPPSISQTGTQPTIQERGAALPAPGDDFYRSRLKVLSAPDALEAGEAATAKVEMANLSPYRWLAVGRESDHQGSVRLSYHWCDDSGNVVQWEGERAPLPCDLEPQNSANAEMRIFAPFAPGNYTLEITLVQEGIAWFDQKGSAPVRMPVRVEPLANRVPQLPSCSIVVPVFNQAALTKSCLLGIERSICADRIQYEVIVADNGSTEGTPNLLKSWSGSRSNARVVPLGRNLGFAAACNAGARMARGHYLLFLNNDTLPTPGWLENMLRLAESEPRVGIVGSKLLYPDGKIQHVGVAFEGTKTPRHIYRGFPSKIRPAGESREYQAVTGACLLVKKEIYNLVGGMDEIYRNSYEDMDLCLKARAQGYRVLVCADSVLYHLEGMSEGRRAHDYRNAALFKDRWADRIEADLDRWHELDQLREELTEVEAGEYRLSPDRLIGTLWRQVYSCDVPEL
jgi:GT2 family glycosyltransferase